LPGRRQTFQDAVFIGASGTYLYIDKSMQDGVNAPAAVCQTARTSSTRLSRPNPLASVIASPSVAASGPTTEKMEWGNHPVAGPRIC
jgi:hypothetical protein